MKQERVGVWGMVLAGAIGLSACDIEDVGDGSGDAGGKADDASGAEGYCADFREGAPRRYKELDIEGDDGYVAKALACASEGDEPEEYLKALAVVMRSIAIYQDPTCGTECNNWKCRPNDAHKAAVRATQGEFLWYEDNPIFGFHSAGHETITAQCEIDGKIRNRTTPGNTCKFGDDVVRSGLAWKPQYDRGSLHHEVAQCMADMQGATHIDLLREFYGEDIGIGCDETHEPRVCRDGEPVEPAPPDEEPKDPPSDDDGEGDDDDDGGDGGDGDAPPFDPETPTCSDGNHRPADAHHLGDDFGEGPFSAWSFEGLQLPPGGQAWFDYTGVDAWPRGNAQPYVWAAAEGAELEVCQYYRCADGPATTVVTCDGGVAAALADGTQGCCASARDEVELYLGNVECPNPSNGDESGTVLVSVSQAGGVCQQDLQLQVDFG